ncbi:alkaline phosphatase D family protein [Epibacterium ulvae]|uniref:alkaline phosphatase D family protein n=1 Tax=Epibacterium ulvae TaxID=1156985 RepID=UPI0024905D00|nr:alkaline phosphatase D family protein [Epibacterium ulvae]
MQHISSTADIIGPVLILDHTEERQLHLAALFIVPHGVPLPDVTTASGQAQSTRLASYSKAEIWAARFTLPTDQNSWYTWNGETFSVATDYANDLRIAYVSCNGEEHGDLEREGSERNAMWARLKEQHKTQPFGLLLHGGDQVYADEATHDHPLSADWPEKLPRDPSRAELQDLHTHLREKFFERYASLYRSPEFAWIAARVPSLMQWDDHDICDGWGSLRRSRTYSPVGQTLFTVAREAFLVFQHASTSDSLPGRFKDSQGHHLGWDIALPNLRIVAPDLRSERTRRDIMGPGGWNQIEATRDQTFEGRTFLMSSVPLLGPRLSLIEAIMVLIPQMQKYEDDLRDQWQSRAHRDSWRRMLRLMIDMCQQPNHNVTALSGEIHLATRATMRLKAGDEMHQLVASGIAHRAPPKVWARILGNLAWLGEAPLAQHPIRIRRIPGQRFRYVAERNYLILERQNEAWTASWDIESSGLSAPMQI